MAWDGAWAELGNSINRSPKASKYLWVLSPSVPLPPRVITRKLHPWSDRMNTIDSKGARHHGDDENHQGGDHAVHLEVQTVSVVATFHLFYFSPHNLYSTNGQTIR